MTIEHRELWPGHTVHVIKVKKWRHVYRYFNVLFARAHRRWEWMIEAP
jgi:hypothetical protein